MPLSNSQYDEIMRDYNARQLKNRRITEARRKAVYDRAPRLKEIEDAISASYVAIARCRLSGDAGESALLKSRIRQLREEKSALFAALGISEHEMDPVYDCPDCQDTGFINGRKCHCFKQAIINTIYAQSNIRNILEKENFSTFSYKYYSPDKKSRTTGLSSLETIRQAVDTCHDFIDHFDKKPRNLLFYGDTGVGKTFLTNCIAKELMDQGRSVIYFTAFQLFDLLGKGIFDRDSDAISAHQNIFECDLLIIDDLGTELSNSFTVSQLFLCLNERILREKSTIISTNLSMNKLLDIYSERTFSRITSNYTVIKLFGDDIRLQKRIR